jgi:hypothetical protein
MDPAGSCRKRAEEAFTIADKLTDPLDRAAWLKVAGEWIDLAENAEASTESTHPLK